MMILLGGSIVSAFFSASSFTHGRYIHDGIHDDGHRFHRHIATATTATEETPHEESSISSDAEAPSNADKKKQVLIVGAGWGGLSAAHALSKNSEVAVTVIEASPRVGGLVRDGFTSVSGQRPAEAGQHGFWENYHNVYRLLREDLTAHCTDFTMDAALTDYAEQGQYSPRGLEAVWPVYQRQAVTLPTGLAQALYTRFDKLPLTDLATAAPLVLAFSEFDDSPEAWARYDDTSFRDLCVKLGVSKRCYEEAFEPMILTGLFAPGRECSAAAALGMAYFFVLKDQKSFDVRWCKGNIGRVIFDPWVKLMETNGVTFQTNTRVVGFELNEDGKSLSGLTIKNNDDDDDTTSQITADTVVLAVGAEALNAFVRFSPTTLGQYAEFRRFANLRGTSVLATRIFLDRTLTVPFSANACWGFDEGVGMTVFDISTLHGGDADTTAGAPGSVLEVDYYHAQSLLVLDDDAVVAKVKADLDTVLGAACRTAAVVDAAVVRLPRAVNWYYPGSYKDMPDLRSESLHNLFFVGDIVRSRHGSWSQEKAFVTGMEAANVITGRPVDEGIVPLAPDEPHVAFGRNAVSAAKRLLGFGDASQGPSLVDFLVR